MSNLVACVDGRDLSLAQGSGIATYGRNLLTTLSKLGVGTQVLYGPASPLSAEKVLNEIALVGPTSNGGRPTKIKRIVRTEMARFGIPAWPVVPSHVVWPRDGAPPPQADAFWAARELYRMGHRSFVKTGNLAEVKFRPSAEVARPDVCHWTAIMPFHGRGAVNIYTMHDLIPLILPHLSLSDKSHYLAMCREIARRADHIIVGSESAKADIVAMLGVDPERITNTYHAVELPAGHMDRSDEDVARELDGAFGLGWKNYLLHYGTIEPRKNLGRIVEAYLASGVQTPLVIAGGDGWLFQPEVALLEQVRDNGGSASGRILKLKYLPAGVLASLVRGAKALLFPSLYEGFGLPVLEAMSMGTAVLTATAGSLPEVAGSAAVLVDPYSVEEIRAGIVALDQDHDLRADLETRGAEQAALFSPAAYQERVRGVYEKLGLL
jgi:glycosyltransferase involved in cell wall biosynthesis